MHKPRAPRILPWAEFGSHLPAPTPPRHFWWIVLVMTDLTASICFLVLSSQSRRRIFDFPAPIMAQQIWAETEKYRDRTVHIINKLLPWSLGNFTLSRVLLVLSIELSEEGSGWDSNVRLEASSRRTNGLTAVESQRNVLDVSIFS